ncbi:MAG: ANTAR domain-containing protein [Acidimicrobiales bacterium]
MAGGGLPRLSRPGSPKLSPDDAFELLRKASRRENVKLREISRRIADNR